MPSLTLGFDRYFITSKHDDDRGVGQTYTLLPPTSDERQFFASSTMFILVVNAVVAGTLAGLVAKAVDGSGAVIAIAAAVAGTSYFVALMWFVLRRIRGEWGRYVALFPHPEELLAR